MATRSTGAQFIPVYVQNGEFVTASQARRGSEYWGCLGVDARQGKWRLIREGAGTPLDHGFWIGNTSPRAIREHLASVSYLLQG